MARLENEFSWSASRANTLAQCARQYYWNYYGSWGGWEKWAEEETKLAYCLKKLASRYTWAGDVVHAVIRRALGDYKERRTVDSAALIEGAHEAMAADFRASRKGPRSKKGPHGFWGLVEHEYRDEVTDEEWREIWNRVKTCLTAFFASELPAKFQALPAEKWIEMDQGKEGQPPSWVLDGVRMYAIPDLVVDAGPKEGVVVYDWKTGRQKPEDRDQVLGYAFYLSSRYHDIDPSAVSARAVYLLTQAQQVKYSTSVEELAAYKRRLLEGIERGKKYLADVRNNTPLPQDAFPMTRDSQTCRHCPYRRLCGR